MTTMNPVSFSKAELLLLCPASGAIPWVDGDAVFDDDGRLNDEEDAAAPRREGKVAHAFLESVSTLMKSGAPCTREEARERALLLVPEEDRHIVACIELDHLPVDLRAEVAFAWDFVEHRGRYLGEGLDRRYHALPAGIAPIDRSREIPGTVDILGDDAAADMVCVADYKRGRTRYPRPGLFAQTVLGGLAAASHLGRARARLELYYISEHGDVFAVRDEVDVWDMEITAAKLERAIATARDYLPVVAAGGAVPLVTGQHCRRCPARKNCNATTALVRALPEQMGMILAEGPWRDLALDRRARRYHLVAGLRKLLDEMMSEIYLDAAGNPVDLGDGTVLRAEPYEREKLVGDVAFRVMSRMYGAEAAENASHRTMSKDAAKKEISMRRKPGEKVESKKGGGLWDRFLVEVRQQNGTEWERGETVRPVKIK